MADKNRYISTILPSQNGSIQIVTPEKYQALRVIAEGSQGIVIEAWDNINARQVAIKKIKDIFVAQGSVKQCYREFVLGAAVQHDNIIRVIDAYSPDRHWQDFKQIYLVFDIMERNLADLNANRRDLFRDRRGGNFIATLMRQLLCAVRHLHQERLRLIHRDIKPTNILVRHINNNRYHLKLADLGLARQLPGDDEEIISRYVVTRPYRAPEIILTDLYERPVDLWSIGCVLAELMINRILFDERDQVKLVYCIMQYIGVTELEIQQLPEYVRQNVLQDRQRFTTSRLEALLRRDAPDWNSSEFGINELINLAKLLLTFNPAQRITAEQALNLPMWEPMGNSFYSNGDENQNGIYVEDNQQRSGQQWKQVLFNQLQQYNIMQPPH